VKAFVTGVTGKVGHATARLLLTHGYHVRALVLDLERDAVAVPEGAEALEGDVRNTRSVERAVAGCDIVFNAMGVPEQWLRDPAVFVQVNAHGTDTVVRTARLAGVERVVHTSTVEVFGAPPGSSFDESASTDAVKATAYERSKQDAEKCALTAAGAMDVVIVNPAAVYGLGPRGSASLENGLFQPLVRGRLPFLPPGGFGLVFTESLAAGQLLAAERGRPGERYILCDGHLSIRELAEVVVRTAGSGRVPPTAPAWSIRGLAAAGEAVARVTRRPPPVSRGQVHSLLWDPRPQSQKAQRDLGWEPVPVEEGVRLTLGAYGLLRR
jgi:dihydroflavonol-4-reductase